MVLWKLPKYWACSLTFSFLYLFMITMRGNLRNHDTSYFILLICFSNKSLIISKSLGLMCKLIRRRGTSDTWMRKHRPKRLSSEQIISQGVLWRRPIVGEMRRELPPLATWLVPFHFPHCQLACPGVKNSLTEVTSTKHLDSTTSLLFTRFRRFKSDLAFTPKGRKPHLRASQEQSKEQTDSTWAILIIVTRSGIASTLFSFATCY